MSDDPIKASIAYLVETGWTDEQARALLRALKCDTPDKLLDLVPKWIDHCGQIRQHMTLLECVVMGPVNVDHNGEEWTYSLDAQGAGT